MHRLMIGILAFGIAVAQGWCFADDGLGGARVIPDTPWVAGSAAKFEVEYTAGPEGIPVGGGVGVSFLHAFSIRLSTDPSAAGYVKAARENGDALALTDVEWPTPDMMTIVDRKYPNGGYYVVHRTVFTKITGTPVKPGEKIRFTFGANDKGVVIPRDVCDNPLRMVVDSKGDRKYRVIESTPECRVIGGPLDHFFVTIPSTRKVGEKADICIRGEDRFNNLSPGCDVEVTLSGMPNLPSSPVKLKDGLARAEAPVTRTGVCRVTVAANGKSARSNPMVVTDKAPAYNIYWGDIHSHSIFSDGLGGDADYLYTYARDCADLDVCATADHGVKEQSRAATRKYHEPGRFVTIWGYEWNETKPGRLDRNIYFSSEDNPRSVGWPATIEEFWKSIEAVYGDNKDHRVIVGPHMFTYKTTCRPWYETWDPRYERFVEIYSEHGASEYMGNPRPLAGGDVQEGFFAQDGLKYGRRFGIIGSSDSHDSRPGRGSNSLRYRGGLVAFLAKDLTREAIWDAWWNRRVYATTTNRIYIDFTIDGHLTGEDYKAAGKPRISYTVHGCDDQLDVYLIRNNSEIKKTSTANGTVQESFTDNSYAASSYYYLRVVQSNGEMAWSSPIWVDSS